MPAAHSSIYSYDHHDEVVLLRPTSTLSAHREAVRFPLDDDERRTA